VNEYQRTLGLSDNSSKLAALIKAAYLQHDNLADATRCLVNGLFGPHGLVIIDADEASFKQRFAPFIEQDILGGHSHEAIEKTSEALQAAGFASQVHAREINFFYLTDTFRERMVKLDD